MDRDDARRRDDPPSDERMYTGEELEDEEGHRYRPQQMNVGPGVEAGGGEWPDPHAPPQAPAPGAVDGDEHDADADEGGAPAR